MATDIVLKLDGIKGESPMKGHEGEIQVLSWNWSAVQSGTTNRAAGNNKGVVNMTDLKITKFIDCATVPLLTACCTGRHIRTAVLTMRKAGDDPLEFYRLKFRECMVSQYEAGQVDSDDQVVETFHLSFGKFVAEYDTQNSDGQGSGIISGGFDLTINEVI